MRVHLHFLRSATDGVDAESVGEGRPGSGRHDHAATLELAPCETTAETLDLVFAVAQRGPDAWTVDRSVRWTSAPDLRSLAAGDVVVLEGSGRRAAFEVTADGFRRVVDPVDSLTEPAQPGVQ